MPKKNNREEEVKTPEENPETEITYSSEPHSIASESNKEQDANQEQGDIKSEEVKTPEEKAINAAKPFKHKDGSFWENGLQKHYIKHKTRKQIEKNGIMIFSDTGHECHYYLNLLPAEISKRREKGEIF